MQFGFCRIEFYIYKFILGSDRSTENDHVKTNLVHKIHRIRSFGSLKLQEFKNLLSPEDYAKCEKKRPLTTWYPLNADIFAAFIYKVSL
jgi:hypothetical protein